MQNAVVPSYGLELSKNAQKRALRKEQKKAANKVVVNELLLETKRHMSNVCVSSQCSGQVTSMTTTSKQQLHGGGKASRARRARGGDVFVGTSADHRPSGGAPVEPQDSVEDEMILALERFETQARLRLRPDMLHRKVIPTDNHGSMDDKKTEFDCVVNDMGHVADKSIGTDMGSYCCLSGGNFRLFSLSLLPSSVSHESLISLDLSRNELWDLPEDLAAFSSLRQLDISRNWFRNLPKSISHLSRSLESLDACHNMLCPSRDALLLDVLAHFPQLHLLDLTCNQKCGRQSLLDLCHQSLPHVATIKITINFPPLPGSFVGSSAAERDATLLRSQLEPWSTTALRRRLVADFGAHVSIPDQVPRSQVMKQLLLKYAEELDHPTSDMDGGVGGRLELLTSGTLVSEKYRIPLLAALQSWSRAAVDGNRERTSIRATNYMILTSPLMFTDQHEYHNKEKDDETISFSYLSSKAAKAAAKWKLHKTIWDLANLAMASVDPLFAQRYTALAVTHGFQGSPHIDKQNVGPFYGLALGDFDEGSGGIRVECSARVVATVNTKNRLGKVDGRYPHWVAPYDVEKERYSLIYYRTSGERESIGPAIFGPGVPVMKKWH